MKKDDKMLLKKEIEPVNPFINETLKMTCYEWIKCIIMSILLIPLIRIILFIVFFNILVFYIWVVMLGHDDTANKPMACWRRVLLFPARLLIRLIMFIIGFMWISVKHAPSNGHKANLILSNHIGMFDSLYYLVYHLPSVAMKDDLKTVPLLG